VHAPAKPIESIESGLSFSINHGPLSLCATRSGQDGRDRVIATLVGKCSLWRTALPPRALASTAPRPPRTQAKDCGQFFSASRHQCEGHQTSRTNRYSPRSKNSRVASVLNWSELNLERARSHRVSA
jgi:hypothetical protein